VTEQHRLLTLTECVPQAVCEVEVQITDAQTGNSTVLNTVLTAGSTRAYKLDGKNKTGKEVKEFLRERGLSLEHTCVVIKQRQVTQLADKNGAQQFLVRSKSSSLHFKQEDCSCTFGSWLEFMSSNARGCGNFLHHCTGECQSLRVMC
jgi:hypothetical protein